MAADNEIRNENNNETVIANEIKSREAAESRESFDISDDNTENISKNTPVNSVEISEVTEEESKQVENDGNNNKETETVQTSEDKNDTPNSKSAPVSNDDTKQIDAKSDKDSGSIVQPEPEKEPAKESEKPGTKKNPEEYKPVPREPENRRILQPPVDGVTIDISGKSCFLNIRRGISAEDLRLVKRWMEQHKNELVLENRYNINSVSISVRNGKVAIDDSFVEAVKSISNFNYFEYNTGSIEVADNQSRDILPELFKDASHIHTWGSTEELEEMKSGVLVKHLSGVYGKVFSFGTQGSKYNAQKKTFTNRITEIGGLSGIESINVIQTGAGATVAKENAFSNNLVDLDENRREESLSHARDSHVLTTSYEYTADYGKAFKKLFGFKTEDFAQYVKDINTKTIEELKDSENVIHKWKKANEKALDAYARFAGYTKSVTDETGNTVIKSDIDSLMDDIAKDFSRNTVLDVNKLLNTDVVAKAYEIDKNAPDADKTIKAKINELREECADNTEIALEIEKRQDLRRLIEIAEAFDREKRLIEEKAREKGKDASKTPAEPTAEKDLANVENKNREVSDTDAVSILQDDTDERSTLEPADGTVVDDTIINEDKKETETEKSSGQETDGKVDDELSKTVPNDGSQIKDDSHVNEVIKDREGEAEIEVETFNIIPRDAEKDDEKTEKTADKEEDGKDKKVSITSRIKNDNPDALVNYRRIAWMQSFNRLSSGLYKETRTYRDGRKEVFDNVSRYSDRENFLASEERDISFEIKTVTVDFRTRQKLESAIRATDANFKAKLAEYNKAEQQSESLEGSKLDKDKETFNELTEKMERLKKEMEKIDANKFFLGKALNDFVNVSSKQIRSVSFEMFRAFCTADRMSETSLGGTFVNRGNFSAKGAALAGKDWKIVNDPVRTDNMLLHMAGRIEAECAKLYTDFNSMVTNKEFTNKLIKPEEFSKTTDAFAASAALFESFKKKHDEVIENKKALESAWDAAFRKAVSDNGEIIDTTLTYQETSENPEFKEAYRRYKNSMSELMDMANSTARDLSLALKDLGNNIKEEDRQAVMDNLCGDDGHVSISYGEKTVVKDGKEEIEKIEGYLPMSMSQRVSLFESMIKNPEQTFCVGQGTSHDFGAYAETRGIKNFVEYTDEAYIEEFTRGQTNAKEAKLEIRNYLDNLLSQLTDGELGNSENMKLEDFKEEISKRCAHMAGAEDLISIVEQKYTEFDKANAWDKLYPTFDDYVALQCETGIKLKAEWDKKREEETKVNANPEATSDEKRDAKLRTEAAKQDYEDFKLSRKTRLSTHMFQNSDNEKVSADFCYHEKEKEIFRNDRSTEPLQLTSRNGDLTEITGEDKEIKALSGREYWAARWSLMKAGIKKGMSTFIESFRNMSVTEAVLQIILANLLLAHKIVSVAKKGILYAHNSAKAETLTGKRAVLGLFIEGDFEKERDEKGKVIGLKIKKEALERVSQAGVSLYNDGKNGQQRFRVDLCKATGGKRSGSVDFSIRVVKDLKNAELARAIESKLADQQEKAEAYVRKIDNKRAKKETRIIDEIEREKLEMATAKKEEYLHKQKKNKIDNQQPRGQVPGGPPSRSLTMEKCIP